MPIVVQASDLRRYSDDVLTTASGEAPSAALPGNIAARAALPIHRRLAPHRPLRSAQRARPRRDRRRLRRLLPSPRPPLRAPRHDRGRARPRGRHPPLPATRGPRRRARPPQHRHRVRLRRGARPLLLRHALRRGPRLSRPHRGRPPHSLPGSVLASAVRVLAKAARALHFAHEAGFVHCDIQPGNILVDAEGEPHITDFGIARQVRVDQLPTMPTATIAGTPSYMSPEQASGSAGLIGPRSDVFALGALLYDLCTGRPPFVSEASNDTISTIMSLLTEPPEPPPPWPPVSSAGRWRPISRPSATRPSPSSPRPATPLPPRWPPRSRPGSTSAPSPRRRRCRSRRADLPRPARAPPPRAARPTPWSPWSSRASSRRASASSSRATTPPSTTPRASWPSSPPSPTPRSSSARSASTCWRDARI
jgi:hypothetical protein